jgi:hypothetical protein
MLLGWIVATGPVNRGTALEGWGWMFSPEVYARSWEEVEVFRVAFMTFGVLHEPRAHERSKGFVDRVPRVFEQAERSDGFIDRSRVDPDSGLHSWGPLVCPRFLDSQQYANAAQTLSLWQSLESALAFSYADHHAETLGRRSEWFRKSDFPGYVIWWVPDTHLPSFVESTARLDQLQEDGPTAQAFNFKRPFDARGEPTVLDQRLVRQFSARNAAKARSVLQET